MNDVIRAFQKKLDDLSVKAERLRPIVRACEDASERSGLKVTISIDLCGPSSVRITLTTFVEKMSEIVALFRELAKEGLRTDKEETFKDSMVMGAIPTRIYNLGPDVVVCAFTGSKCEMKQVGVQEIPVYEMECGE